MGTKLVEKERKEVQRVFLLFCTIYEDNDDLVTERGSPSFFVVDLGGGGKEKKERKKGRNFLPFIFFLKFTPSLQAQRLQQQQAFQDEQ